MAGLFSKPKEPSLPPPPAPAAVPELDLEAQKKKRRRRGRSETIITGELEPETTKKTLLG